MKTERGLRFKVSLCTIMALLMTLGLVLTQAAQAAPPPIPGIEGPITGPGPMYSGLVGTPSTTTPLADFGYIAEEYFVSGTANGKSYKIRILVRRPEVPQKFSGIVLSECMHSNGFSVTFGPMRAWVMLSGHVHVEIDAQTANVSTLQTFNVARYGTLAVPAGQTSEIIAQVGRLIKSNLMIGPLYPLFARHLILQGTSQASAVLRTYQDQIHFQERMPDGSAIMDGYFATSTLGSAPMKIVDVPTVQMPTMTEVNSAALAAVKGNPPFVIAYRRPDSDTPDNRFRIYEVAGMSHANSRDTVTYVPNPCDSPISEFPWGAMAAMGANHLVEWVDKGTVPPHAPYIAVDFDTTNDGSLLQLDAYGNAEGGVRNTYVDVPAAKYGVPNSASGASAFVCSIAGFEFTLPQATLDSLYKNRGQYISQINHDLMDLIRDGWFLQDYADMVRSDAQVASKTLIKP